VTSDEYSLTVAANGPVLLQEAYLIEKLAHFVRERVPDRVYHVKGGGAFGYFEVTADVTQWTRAAFLNTVGKRTPLLLRFIAWAFLDNPRAGTLQKAFVRLLRLHSS